MMQLKSDGTTLTSIIKSVIPKQETYQINNRLLSGAWHVQIIGGPGKKAVIEVVATGAEVKAINSCQAQGSTVQLIQDGTVLYQGYIAEPIEWSRLKYDLYKGTFELLVVE